MGDRVAIGGGEVERHQPMHCAGPCGRKSVKRAETRAGGEANANTRTARLCVKAFTSTPRSSFLETDGSSRAAHLQVPVYFPSSGYRTSAPPTLRQGRSARPSRTHSVLSAPRRPRQTPLPFPPTAPSVLPPPSPHPAEPSRPPVKKSGAHSARPFTTTAMCIRVQATLLARMCEAFPNDVECARRVVVFIATMSRLMRTVAARVDTDGGLLASDDVWTAHVADVCTVPVLLCEGLYQESLGTLADILAPVRVGDVLPVHDEDTSTPWVHAQHVFKALRAAAVPFLHAWAAFAFWRKLQSEFVKPQHAPAVLDQCACSALGLRRKGGGSQPTARAQRAVARQLRRRVLQSGRAAVDCAICLLAIDPAAAQMSVVGICGHALHATCAYLHACHHAYLVRSSCSDVAYNQLVADGAPCPLCRQSKPYAYTHGRLIHRRRPPRLARLPVDHA